MSRLIGALLCVCLLACGLGQAAHGQPLAVYKGNSYGGRVGVAAFERFMGRRVDAVADFIDFASRDAFDNDVTYTANGWKGYDRPLILGVPVLCKGETFADIVAGKHDASYLRFAQTFNAAGVKLLAIRLGWEDNSQTTPGYASQDVAGYKAARRHLYALLKPLLPGTLILQDFANGWHQVTVDKLIDPQSMDGLGWTAYPQTWSTATAEPAFTANLINESWGLKTLASWYPTLPIVITEYGAAGTRADGHGAPNKGDDPAWTVGSIKTIAALGARVKAVVVWDFHAGDFNGLLSDGSYPQAGAALKAAFAQTPVAPVVVSTPVATVSAKIDHGGTVVVAPNADGSAILNLGFPLAPLPVTYTITLSEPRKLGFGNGKGGLSGGLWNGGGPYARFTWGVSASTAPQPQVYVSPK